MLASVLRRILLLILSVGVLLFANGSGIAARAIGGELQWGDAEADEEEGVADEPSEEPRGPDAETDGAGGSGPPRPVLEEEDGLPGMKEERRARELERRGEPVAACALYAAAAVQTARAGGQPVMGRDPMMLWARSEFYLARAAALFERTLAEEPLVEAASAIAGLEGADPILRARAKRLQAELALRAGRAEEARTLSEELGLLRTWRILGPFDNERGRGFSRPLAPERWPPAMEQSFDGLREGLSWRKARPASPLGFVDLNAYFRPRDECLAYALTAVHVKEETPAALRIGSDDMIQIWLNGHSVHSFTGRRSARFDQQAVGVVLKAGWNVLLVKCGDAKLDWGFYLRFTTPDGSPLGGLQTSTDLERIAEATQAHSELPDLGDEISRKLQTAEEGDVPPYARDTPGPAVNRGAIDQFNQALEHDPYDARARYYLGWLLLWRHVHGVADRTAIEHLHRAARADEPDPAVLLAFADAAVDHTSHEADRDQNVRRVALERAMALDEKDVTAHVRLARYYMEDMGNYVRARKLAEAAAAHNPMAVDPQLVLHDLDVRRGWTAAAATRLERVRHRHPDDPAGLLRAGSAALRTNRNEAAVRIYRRLLGRDQTMEKSAEGMIESLRRMGRHTVLIDELRRLLAVRPYAEQVRSALVETFLSADNPGDALAAVDSSLRICPHNAEMLALRGTALKALGREDEALAAWNQAFRFKPTMVKLRRQVDLLQGTRDRLGTRIADLRAYALANRAAEADPTQSRYYLLREQVDRLNPDGTTSSLVHEVIEILDEEAAADLATTWIDYAAQRESLRVVTARVLHADGTLAAGRVTDHEPQDRLPGKMVRFTPLEVGDVVEIAYRHDEFRKGFFGDYFGEAIGLQRHHPIRLVRYVLETPPQREIYLHLRNGAPPPEVTEAPGTGRKTRVWELHDIPALETEAYMPHLRELAPLVEVSTFQDWDALARWYWHLIKDQYVSTDAIRRQVRRITMGKRTPLEKLAAIHRWVTSEIQNVAWEFDVHGYKPYKVSTVFQRRFGDCKDKAGLIVVMAREVGLEAWPALLRATEDAGPVVGRGEEDLSLPLLNHFNHAIAAVEVGDQLLWLDGTAPERVLGRPPRMDAGAAAVIVRPEGARLATVPALSAEKNGWFEEGSIVLDERGAGTLQHAVSARGRSAVFMRYYFGGGPRDAGVLENLVERRWGPAEVQSASLTPSDNPLVDRMEMDARMRLERLGEREGGTLRFQLPQPWLQGEYGRSPLPEAFSIFAEASIRTHDVVLPEPFAIERTLRVHLPEGFEIINLPEPIDLTTPFGTLKGTWNVDGQVLKAELAFRIEKTRIPTEQYAAFRRFCHRCDRIASRVYVLETAE
jgi:tetratricopeptide (TPR) repeat protein